MLAEFLAVPFVVLVNVANLVVTLVLFCFFFRIFGELDLIGQSLVTDFS